MDELWQAWPPQAWLSLRKRAGLPASADVGILSAILKELLAKESLGFPHDIRNATNGCGQLPRHRGLI